MMERGHLVRLSALREPVSVRKVMSVLRTLADRVSALRH
jgi:hypothetical protein